MSYKDVGADALGGPFPQLTGTGGTRRDQGDCSALLCYNHPNKSEFVEVLYGNKF